MEGCDPPLSPPIGDCRRRTAIDFYSLERKKYISLTYYLLSLSGDNWLYLLHPATTVFRLSSYIVLTEILFKGNPPKIPKSRDEIFVLPPRWWKNVARGVSSDLFTTKPSFPTFQPSAGRCSLTNQCSFRIPPA